MEEIKRAVSFKIESAPSSGRYGAGHTEQPTIPRTAPAKIRPGILRSPSVASSSGVLGLQISGQKLAHTPTNSTVSATEEHPDKTLDPAKVAADVRLTTSHKMHEEVKCLRYESSKIRETLLKVEEEVKHASRAKKSLETTVQDIRTSISVNQQSLSVQEKKSREENPCLKLLKSEMTTLSKCKQDTESKLQALKKLLQEMDQSRKLLQGKLSSSSQNLQLDAQRYMVYHGPIVARHDSYSRQRHYASSCPQPKKLAVTVDTDLLSKALRLVTESRSFRQQLKGFLSEQQTRQQEMTTKIKQVLRSDIAESRLHQSKATVRHGQLRVQQNGLARRQHNEEVALGIAKGPVSALHRSVSESTDRPLTRLRPESAKEEIENFKETVTTINRKLSATWGELSEMDNPKKTVNREYRSSRNGKEVSSRALRLRVTAATDNKWVSGL